jgi:hypothetical protein
MPRSVSRTDVGKGAGSLLMAEPRPAGETPRSLAHGRPVVLIHGPGAGSRATGRSAAATVCGPTKTAATGKGRACCSPGIPGRIAMADNLGPGTLSAHGHLPGGGRSCPAPGSETDPSSPRGRWAEGRPARTAAWALVCVRGIQVWSAAPLDPHESAAVVVPLAGLAVRSAALISPLIPLSEILPSWRC